MQVQSALRQKFGFQAFASYYAICGFSRQITFCVAHNSAQSSAHALYSVVLFRRFLSKAAELEISLSKNLPASKILMYWTSAT